MPRRWSVAEEVTDETETAVQQLGQLELVTSISELGKSTVLVEMKDKYGKNSLPQVWDELRPNITDARSKLLPGVRPSLVYDDFGDVYSVFYAVDGDGYSYAELKDFVGLLRCELFLRADVGNVTIYADRPEAVYVEISRARLARLGTSPAMIYQTLSARTWCSRPGWPTWAARTSVSSQPASSIRFRISGICSSSRATQRRPGCTSRT